MPERLLQAALHLVEHLEGTAVNRRFFERALSLVSFPSGSSAAYHSRRRSDRNRSRRLAFETCERRELLAVTVSGTKFDTFSSSGFTPGQDQPLAGVTINLFQENNNNQVLDAGDGSPIQSTATAANGTYSFNIMNDGRYYIQEVVPTGYTQSAGPAYYAINIINGAVFTDTTTNIDNFSDPDPAQTFFISALNPNPFFTQTGPPAPGVIGGQRDLLVAVQGNPNPISANGFFGTISMNNGVFNLGTASNGPGTEVTLQYDGVDASIANAQGLSADLTANGNNGIRLDFNFLQVGTGTTMDLEVAATSPGGGTATFSQLVTAHTGPFSVFIPFSSFSTSGPFTFSNVSSLQFFTNESGVQDVDYELNQIVAAQQRTTGFDFGNFPILSQLSGYKYVDSNKNGHRDPGELPVEGVIIKLDGTDDLGKPVHLQTTTDVNGFYQFGDLQTTLRPGNYTVTEIPPINFIVGMTSAGTINGIPVGIAINNDPTQPRIEQIIITQGGSIGVDYDFGEVGLKPPYVSKRDLIVPNQPVQLVAIYSDTPAVVNNVSTTAVKPATTTTKKTTKVTPPPAPPKTVKLPPIVVSKTTKKKK
jgi:hypothetical protein